MTRFSQNNLIRVNADGTVDAVFPGGITMLAGTSATPPASRRIRWLKESDGSLVAYIETYELLNIRTRNDGLVDSPGAYYFQGLIDDNGAQLTGILSEHNPPAVENARVRVRAGLGPGFATRILLDDDARANYVQLTALMDLRFHGGLVNGAGAINAGRETTDFSITRTAAGRYTFTGDDNTRTYTPFSLMIAQATQGFEFINAFTNVFTFTYGFNTSAGVATDMQHTVMAFSIPT